MALFHRRDIPPAAATALLAAEERVISWADTESGSAVLATPRGLWWPDGPSWRLIGWHLVSKATWQEGVLAVVQGDVVDDLLIVDRPVVAEKLARPRNLPPTVRKRVEANVVSSELAPVPGGAALLVARRVPGEDGLHWWGRLEPGTARSEPVASSVASQLARLQAAWAAEHDARSW